MLKFSLNLVLSPIIVHQLFFPKLNFAEHEISLMVSLIVVPLFPAQIFKYNGTRVEIFLCTFRKHIFSQNFMVLFLVTWRHQLFMTHFFLSPFVEKCVRWKGANFQGYCTSICPRVIDCLQTVKNSVFRLRKLAVRILVMKGLILIFNFSFQKKINIKK